MGMSTHIVGFKPPDEKWEKMKAIWDSCKKAGIDCPNEVDEYFEGEPPDSAGVEVEIEGCEWSDEMREGFEIKLDELPKDVKTVRFYNSY